MTNARSQECIEESISLVQNPAFYLGSGLESEPNCAHIELPHMTEIDCLSIKLRTTLFDRPYTSVVVGATASNATMRIHAAC